MDRKPKKLKWGIIAFLLLLLLLLVYKFIPGENGKDNIDRQDQALAVSVHSEGFTQSFQLLLTNYHSLASALAVSDSVLANKQAKVLKIAADSLQLQDLDADTTGAIRSLAEDLSKSVSAEVDGLLAEPTLEQKRRELELISDQIWTLARALKYKGPLLYNCFTAAAFNAQGAYWLSNGKFAKDPYTGMQLEGNTVFTDSLGF
jgi:hypothetical protein